MELLAIMCFFMIKQSVSYQGTDTSHMPLAWSSPQIEFKIPRDFPPNVRIFGLKILTLPYVPESFHASLQGSEISIRCGFDSTSNAQAANAIRQDTKRKNSSDKYFSGTGFGIRSDSFHKRSMMSEWSEHHLRPITEEKLTGSRPHRFPKRRRIKLTNNVNGIFKLMLDEQNSVMSLSLTRSLKLRDYTQGPTEHYINVSISATTCTKFNTKIFKKIYDVQLFIQEPFNCANPDQTMCMLPTNGIHLHQFENRLSSALLILPSLHHLCPNVRKQVHITVQGSDGKPELSFNSNVLQVSQLDREKRASNLTLSASCTINSVKLVPPVEGFLFIEDENDSPPIELRNPQVAWKYPLGLKDAKDGHRNEIVEELAGRIMVLDPDLVSSNDFSLVATGPASKYVNLSLVKYHVGTRTCYEQTVNLPSPTIHLNANCTILTPSITFLEDIENVKDSEMELSIIFTDVGLLRKELNNEVRYNVTLILNSTSDLSTQEINNQIHLNDINPQNESNVTIFRSPQKYARLSQIITARNKEQLESLLHQSKFQFHGREATMGLGITPLQGILYVADPAKFEKALDVEGFLEVTVQQAKLVKKFFIEWSEGKCEQRYHGTCAKHIYNDTCESSCGVGTSSNCRWRQSRVKFQTPHYSTCSPGFATCPDQYCDELELLDDRICPQDCIKRDKVKSDNVKMNKAYDPPRGIKEGFGVCSCDDFCLCFPVHKNRSIQYIRKNHEITATIKDYDSNICGSICKLSIGGGIFVFILAGLFVVVRRYIKCDRKQKNQHNITQYPQEYFDDHSSSYGSGHAHGDVHFLAIHGVNNWYPNHSRSAANCREATHDMTLANFSIDRKWEFPRNQLILEQCLGEGEFGKVMKAKAYGLKGNPGNTPVAVKMLKKNSTAAELADLLSEFELLKEVSHPNVILLLGACTTKGGPIYLIMEYCKYGSLRSFLNRSRHYELESEIGATLETVGTDYNIEPKDLLRFAWQICKGMSYLTNMKLVHRDLAARNVLLSEDRVCKISDFGLTRDVYEGDLYYKRSKGRVPVKWMAIESLADHVYTHKSDVWGFGVLLWELVTLGSFPYPGVTPERLFPLLKTGYRMERPGNCSQDLYEVMRSCWADEPERRPTFSQLTATFERMIQANVEYLELRSLIVTNRIYFDDSLKDHENSDAEKKNDSFLETNFERTEDTTSLDGDSYLVAHSRSSSSGKECTASDNSAPAEVCSKISNGRIHAHNPTYSPTTGNPHVPAMPPHLEYTTLEDGPDEEEDAKVTQPSENGSDIGPLLGDSGYITDGSRNSHSSGNNSVHVKLGKYTPDCRDLENSSLLPRERDWQSYHDESELIRETSLSGSGPNALGSKFAVKCSSLKDGASPDSFCKNQSNKRSPVIV